jgi:hypothetical protein
VAAFVAASAVLAAPWPAAAAAAKKKGAAGAHAGGAGAGTGAGAAGSLRDETGAKPVTTVYLFAEGAAAARRAEVLGALEEELTVNDELAFTSFAALLGDVDEAYDKRKDDAVARCAEARPALEELDVEKALPELKKCVADLEALVGLSDVTDDLYDAQKSLALAAFLGGEEKLAAAALRQALVLKPDTTKIDSAAFPKRMRPLVDDLLLNFELDRGSVEVEADPPGAEVYLNGVLAGISPLKLDNLYYGRNYLTVRAPGLLPYVGKLTVDAPSLAPARITLPASKIDVRGELEAMRAKLGETFVPAKAAGLRKKLAVDVMVFGLLRPGADRAADLALFAYDLRTGKRLNTERLTLPAGDRSPLASGVERLFTDLMPDAGAGDDAAAAARGPGLLAKLGAGAAKAAGSPLFWATVGGGVVAVAAVAVIVVVAGGARAPAGGWFVAGL